VIYDEQDRERLKALVSEEPHQIKAVQARLQQETGKISCTMTIKLELPAFSHSRRLNVLGFLSRRGKRVYHTTTDTVTTPVVIEAFDRLLGQKSPVLTRAQPDRNALEENQV
jgi:hypothetical protein